MARYPEFDGAICIGGLPKPEAEFAPIDPGIAVQVGLGEGAYQYAITIAGIARAREALDRSQYAGPAPVPIQVYNESVLKQAHTRMTVTSRTPRRCSAR